MGLILPQYIDQPNKLNIIKQEENNFDITNNRFSSSSQNSNSNNNNNNHYNYNYIHHDTSSRNSDIDIDINSNSNSNTNFDNIEDTISIKKLKQNFKTYACSNCRTHLSSTQEIMSRDYRGKTGDAYLMNKLVNIEEGFHETRIMMTGEYLVCDINCSWCHQLIGWKYLKSDTLSQKYKEGRYIMELKPICITD